MPPVYTVDNLTKVYPQQTRPANDCITLTIEEGEIFGLLGDNGAGKTTPVKQLANLLAPTSGAILLFGRPLGAAPLYVPSRIGYMPQSGFALNNLTVSEALYFTAHLRGLARRDALAERDRLTDQWDLGAARHCIAARLSGGQKRWQLLIDRADVPHYLALLSADRAVEDFHLSTATLEDVYLSLMARAAQPSPASHLPSPVS